METLLVTEPADFSLPPSRRYGYLEKIRSLSVVSADGSSSSSLPARSSSYYSSSKSSSASGGSHHRYVPYYYSFRRRVRLEDDGHRDIARQMVRDGFVVKLIGEFGQQAPGPVLERWFSELDVGWVLRSAPEKELAVAGIGLDDLVRRWTRGFTVMAQALSATHRHIQEERSTLESPAEMEFPTAQLAKQDHNTSSVMACEHDELLQDDDLRLAWFAEATVSKMLAFADALAAVNTWRPMDKFSGLMDVRICITHVSQIIILSLQMKTPELPDSEKGEMLRLVSKIGNTFLDTKDNLGKAVREMIQDARAVIPVLSGRDFWEIFPPSAEIHKATQLIMDYARLFWGYHDELDFIRPYRNGVHNIIQQMISNLINQLDKKSESLSDPSLRYLFLFNNSYFIQDEYLAITGYRLPPDSDIDIKYCYYLSCYLNASWDTVLSCLHHKMPLWFSKPSPLARFESEFQRTCKHQKLWKVPNTELRKSLRKAIIDKVITGPTGFRTYLEAHPEQEIRGSDQQDVEDMVNELFEG
ncbi:hypothetical protein E2562_022008 [Oryza meyeriana var. granulata]|uniref:Exocyst subunit Exo70 family protein n=1 Tax=Oryza meyeriana var. granulata TaxID=110450 RepID=A0A6G1ENF9_9ORYZ|nr:hypothetical protein E2562_022008 [Oryza meyeriana var. granulata]